MGFLKKTKENLNSNVEAMKTGKKKTVDKNEVKKKLKEADEKKQKELEQYKNNDITSAPTQKNYHAIVRLELSSGTSVEEIAELGATFGHREGKQTIKVVNKDNEVIFEENKPDWQNKFKYLDTESIKSKINELQEILKQFQNDEIQSKKDSSGMVYYEEDYLAMLREKEQELAILTLGDKGTYSPHKNGVPVYTFEIIGFFKIPIYRYTDTSIMGLPPAPKIVIGQYIIEMLQRNYRHNETKAERIILTITAVALGIIALALAYSYWHITGMVVDTGATTQATAESISNLMNVSDILNSINNNTQITNEVLNEAAKNNIPTQNTTNIVN